MKLKLEYQQFDAPPNARAPRCPWCGRPVRRKEHSPFCRVHCAAQWGTRIATMGVQLTENRAGFIVPKIPDQLTLGDGGQEA